MTDKKSAPRRARSDGSKPANDGPGARHLSNDPSDPRSKIPPEMFEAFPGLADVPPGFLLVFPVLEKVEAVQAAQEELFNAVDEYAERNRASATAARADGNEYLAKWHERDVRNVRAAQAASFRNAVRRLNAAVGDACMSGYVEHVLVAAKQLTRRGTREWLNQCRLFRELALFNDGGARLDEANRAALLESLAPHWHALLYVALIAIDERAHALTPAVVAAAWAEEPDRMAARLAAECGAFDFKHFQDAWQVFRKLPLEQRPAAMSTD